MFTLRTDLQSTRTKNKNSISNSIQKMVSGDKHGDTVTFFVHYF